MPSGGKNATLECVSETQEEHRSPEEIVAAGKRVLLTGAAALEAIAERLDVSFARAVDLIGGHRGRVILSGVGKSGLIARKIASTLSSTGTPAVFLHAAEAVHGDLGMVQPGDPVILLSKSGATAELVRLLPIFKEQGNPILALLGNIDSPLATAAEIVLDASVSREADHLGLVPTTSTVAMLALGDALACALMARRRFGSGDFARLHPGGQLGRNLLMKVGDVMHPVERVAVVGEKNTIKELVIAMTEYPLGAACVVDDDNNLIGLVTDGDIRRGLRRGVDLAGGLVADLMTRNPIRVEPSLSLREALTLMEDRPANRQISVLPVVADNCDLCIGMLRLHDIYQPYLS